MVTAQGGRDAQIRQMDGHSAACRHRSPVSEATRELPALILWGDEDKLIPVSAAKWFGSTYPENSSHIYKGIGHLPMEECPDASAADVKTWLAARQPVPAN